MKWLTTVILLMLAAGCTRYDYDKPDTPANRAGIKRHLGTNPSAAISNVYYYADEMGADVTYMLSFQALRVREWVNCV